MEEMLKCWHSHFCPC